MKKFLLSLAVLALGANVMNAEQITVDFATATTLPASEAEAASYNVGGVDFTMAYCKKGTYQTSSYLQISGKNNEGKAYIEFKFDKKLTGFTLTTGASGSTNVTVQLSADGTNIGEALKLDKQSSDFSFSIPEANQAAGNVYKLATANKYNAQITKIVFTLDEEFSGETPEPDPTPDPTPTTGTKVVKSTTVQTGKVAFVFEQGYVYTFAESKTYGYLMATAATLADEMTVTDDALFTLDLTENGYTITDCYNRIIGWDGSHWSFNAYSSASEGNSYWDATMEDGKIKLTNKADASVYLGGKTYNSDYEMVPTNYENYPLPYLYVVQAGSGFAELEAEDAGEAVYYNLQGVKVAEPENGLYIKVQGKKATKVMVRK